MKKAKTPSLVSMAIMTTVTVVIWVAYSIYLAYTKEASIKVPPNILKQIDPQINTEILAQSAERVYFERGTTQRFLGVGNNEKFLSPTPTVNENQELNFATGSADLSATNSANN